MSSLSREILHIYNYDNTLKTTSLNKRQTLYSMLSTFATLFFYNTHSALIIAMILLAKYKRGKYCFEQDSYV